MKPSRLALRSLSRIMAVATLTWIGTIPMQAQTPPPPNAPGGPHEGEEGPGHEGHRPNPEKMLERLTAELHLTPEQQTQIKSIIQSEFEQARAIHENKSLPPAEKRTQMKELREKSRASIEAILTPEQKAKFEEMKKREHRRRESEEGAGHPPE